MPAKAPLVATNVPAKARTPRGSATVAKRSACHTGPGSDTHGHDTPNLARFKPTLSRGGRLRIFLRLCTLGSMTAKEVHIAILLIVLVIAASLSGYGGGTWTD